MQTTMDTDKAALKAARTLARTLGRASEQARLRERMCIVTRQRGDENDLIRFVQDPSGVLVPDLKAVLPGRGAWVSARRDVLALAIKRKAFAKALKSDVPVEGQDDLVERTEGLLRRQACGALSMARKAGRIITGFAKVESALKGGNTLALLHAVDAGADGSMKLDRLAGHHGVAVLSVLSHDEMGVSLGREHVIHAALLAGPGSTQFLQALLRLHLFDQIGDQVGGQVDSQASGATTDQPAALEAADLSIKGNEPDGADPQGPSLGDKTAV